MKRTNLKTTVVVVVVSKLQQRHWLGLKSKSRLTKTRSCTSLSSLLDNWVLVKLYSELSDGFSTQ